MTNEMIQQMIKAAEIDMSFGREPYDWETRKEWYNAPFPMEEYENRVKRVRKAMSDKGFDCMLVFGSAGGTGADVRWLINYHNMGGHAVLMLPLEGDLMLTTNSVYHSAPMHSFAHSTWVRDFRPAHLPGTVANPTTICTFIIDFLRERNLEEARIGVSRMELIPAYIISELRKALPGAEFISTNIIAEEKAIKSPLEIKHIERACEITVRGMDAAMSAAAVGVSEFEIASAAYAIFGGEADSICHSMVAAGKFCGLKHKMPSHYRLKDGDMLYVDMGVCLDGYHTDVSRSLCVGNIGSLEGRMLECALEMTDAVIDAAGPGVKVSELQYVTLNIAQKAGLEWGYWPTGFGHGIGTATAELPSLHWMSETVLQPGHVFALEPMITKLGVGTAVVEDNILITSDGCRLLTPAKRVFW
jgi:Xaa-Pro aminopeptidase